MSSPTEGLDQQFESIIQSIDTLELSDLGIYKAFAPLRWHLFRCKLIKRATLAAVIAIVVLAVYYVPVLNWNAAAVGRLTMIQILPYWDWIPLYKQRCLIRDFPEFIEKQSLSRTNILLSFDDCAVCESVEYVPKLEAISFDYLNEHHLMRNLPVVIADSHALWKDRSWKNETIFVEALEPLVLARPCNVQTNLIFGSLSSGKAENTLVNLFEILINVHRNDSWFLHFRNCELKTVKRTRLLIDKPYFYPPHLEMPYTTWILMSNNYRTKSPKHLKMQGLIVIMQLKEVLRVVLRAKADCDRVCSELLVDLNEGESLLYSTNLWTMEYVLSEALNGTTITFVTETYQN
ncbi:uncharacterized protein LOC135711978 [Ochlerotatus camptorhynchus]|uniref:uncharacterized protein LOC135711978 n=1 Tax=Ochlerotatus camptorhynchus TaxID=644619 RepID=UPI0031E33963